MLLLVLPTRALRAPAPPMHHNKQFVKQTKKGKVLKVSSCCCWQMALCPVPCS